MAVESGGPAQGRFEPIPPPVGSQGEALAPQEPRSGGISIIPYIPRQGEMVQVYRGPTLPGDATVIRTAVLEPPSNLAAPRKSAIDVVGAHYAHHGITAPIPEGPISYAGSELPNPGETQNVFPMPQAPEVKTGTSPSDEAATAASWANYERPRDARVTLVGRLSTRAAFHANKDTLEAMAHGQIPTPPELTNVISTYRESARAGRAAFEDYYATLPRINVQKI